MKKPDHNLNDLFAAARNAEVNISLDDVRANLSKNTTNTTTINWKMVIFSISGMLLLISLFFLPIERQNSASPIADHHLLEGTKPAITTKQTNLTKIQKTEENKDKNALFIVNNREEKTNPKHHEFKETVTQNKKQKNTFKTSPIQAITLNKINNNIETKKAIKLNISIKKLALETIPAIELPDFETNTLHDKILEGTSGEIHYMETLKNKETISLKSYKKGGKKHLKLDRYNEQFEIIQSIDLSSIIQEKRRHLHKVKLFNNQLLLVTSEVSSKQKNRLYIGHKIDYTSMEKKGSTVLGEFPLSKTQKRINIQVSSNGKFLLINPKPETTKDQKQQFQKGIKETRNFHVYDSNLNLFYTIKKDNFFNYETAIGKTGNLYIWKTQPNFLATNRSIPFIQNGHVLYQFAANTTDSLVLREDSFLNTISTKSIKPSTTNKETISDSTQVIKLPSISYNHRLVELKGLKLTLSPEGNPILYGYLKNMRGLQQLTFTADSLSPYHYSVLDFKTKKALEAEEARINGVPKTVLKVDEVFFDDAANFYVLSSSYNRSYLPLVTQEKQFRNNNFSEKIPLPYYPSLDIYIHKFNPSGTPIMSTKIASNAVSRNKASNNYSYLFKDENFSVVYLDHIISERPENKQASTSKYKKNTKLKDELTVATTRQNGEIIRFKASSQYNMEDYKPIKYFRNKGETLVLLQSGNRYKISKLSYRNTPKKHQKY